MSWIRRSRRGQALIETAMILPLLILVMLGSADLARAYYYKLEMSGASRAGMRMAVLSTTTDVGKAIRAEPNSAIPDNTTTWGLEGLGNTNDCGTGHTCGNTSGCDPGSATSFVGAQVACFAVRTCTSWSGGTCTASSAWGARPAAGADQGLEVKVVYKYAPVTPIIANFTNGGAFYLAADTTGLQLY